MSWIDELDEHGYNVIVDELVWYLREGRTPTGVALRSLPEPGVEFLFDQRDGAFLRVLPEILDLNWREAPEIIGNFPRLAAFEFLGAPPVSPLP